MAHVPDPETAGVVHDTETDRESGGVLADARKGQCIDVRGQNGGDTVGLCATLADHQLDPTGGLPREHR